MNWNDILRFAVTLFFIMDPLGNSPLFNSILANFNEKERRRIIIRELLIALALLMLFLFAGTSILGFLGLTQPTLNIAGGILLFLISLKMVFPPPQQNGEEAPVEDPFIVPLAMPLVVGPSAIAVLLLMSSTEPDRMLEWAIGVLVAWGLGTLILVSSPWLVRVLGRRGMRAIERLMGMLLVLLSIQMLLNGVSQFVTEMF